MATPKTREPDWGRFGLNDERQPLNPEAGGGGDANGKSQTKDLYGGQAQNENELFAQDQVNGQLSKVMVNVLTFVLKLRVIFLARKVTNQD